MRWLRDASGSALVMAWLLASSLLLASCQWYVPRPSPRLATEAPAGTIALRTGRFVLRANIDTSVPSWREDAARARGVLDRAEALLVPAEDAIADRLAADLGIDWGNPPEIVTLDVAGRRGDGRQGEEAIDAATLEATGACFVGAAILECAFHRAVHTTAARAAMLVAIEDERTKLDDAAKARTEKLAHAVIFYAVGAAIHRVAPAYAPERHFGALRHEDEEAFAWLEREWPKRETEGVAAFGRRAARESVASGR